LPEAENTGIIEVADNVAPGVRRSIPATGMITGCAFIMIKNDYNLGFIKSHIYPAFWIFLLPVFSLWFYVHATSTYDNRFITANIKIIEQLDGVSRKERAEAIARAKTMYLSEMLRSKDPAIQNFIKGLPDDVRFHYTFFRWMTWLALLCIISGIAVFVFMGFSVYFSLRSPQAQYFSLWAGWHILRIFASLQAVAQSCLAVGLSFWLTALWVHRYDMRLILFAVILASLTIYFLLAAIFRRVDDKFPVEGEILDRTVAPRFWEDIDRLSTEIGTSAPDQVIGGIDDQFFVTEHPVEIEQANYTGRTLFVSLSLLRTMPEDETRAVLAHELAHFSGNDTYYTEKISPLLSHYQHYLEALHQGILAKPVFYFAVLFRVLYEISLRRLSREREFRADRIAAEHVSPSAMAAALVRTTVYSIYRTKTEMEILESEDTQANLAQRLKDGFQSFALQFADHHNLGGMTTVHPFDSHPSLGNRFEALGLKLNADFEASVFAKPNDELWYRKISTAEALEMSQWSAYQARFRTGHENVLAWRYLPETDEQVAHVKKFFPDRTIDLGKKVVVSIDYEKIAFEKWARPFYFKELHEITADKDWGKDVLRFSLKPLGEQNCTLPLPAELSARMELIDILQQYHSRHLTAAEFQRQHKPVVGEQTVATRDQDLDT
jgi:Zn-dependent protease with chaperone function